MQAVAIFREHTTRGQL